MAEQSLPTNANSAHKGFSPLIGAAFLALIALICGLLFNSLFQLKAMGQQLNVVVEHHNRKIDIITQTQVAAHIRTDNLFRMVLADDPFVRDDHFLRFNHAGFQVGKGRNALRELGFTAAEQRNFDAQTQLIRRIQAVQEYVIDLLHANENTMARNVLAHQAIPLQEQFNQELAAMRAAYQRANLVAQQQAKQTYRHALLLTLIFGLASITLALLIAWYTTRKINLKSQQVRKQMTELEQSRAALREEATHDPLTGLANRRLFYDRLQQAIRHAMRYGGKVGILYLDMDRFKDINDQYGHHVGDAVLMEVAGIAGRCPGARGLHCRRPQDRARPGARLPLWRTPPGDRRQHRPGALSRRRQQRRCADPGGRCGHVPGEIRQRIRSPESPALSVTRISAA